MDRTLYIIYKEIDNKKPENKIKIKCNITLMAK